MIKSFRESAVKDILDTIEDINSAAGDLSGGKPKRNNTSLNVSSISRASKDLVMSFPVLCDNSLSPQTAGMICKAVERKAVTMLQMIFASYTFKGNNGRDMLKQWHNNIDDSNFTLDDYMDLCAKLESYKETTEDRKAINEALANIKIEMRNNAPVYQDSFSESSINDYRVTSRYGDVMVTEAGTPGTRSTSFHYDENDLRDAQVRNYNSNIRMNALRYQQTRDQMRRDNDREISDAQYRELQMNQMRSGMLNNDANFFGRQLLDTDVKKANELVPSLMIVRFTDDSNNQQQFVAGVKARLVGIDSMDIISRIAAKNKDRSGLLNLVRATTKEISFVKDYLLAVDKAKLDAKNNSSRNKSNRIWKTLEKRSTKSVWKRMWSKSNDAGCITTLVISQEVANLLKKEYDVNIADLKTATTIMDAYNLLALVIVDESTEVARFLYDGDSMFEDLSFNSLERESGDGSYKKVINLLTKMNK